MTCHVARTPLFGRDGDNLTVRVPITFAEAALGADVEVPTLDGATVTLRVKPGTQSGSKHRVKGHGVASQAAHGRPDRHRRRRRADQAVRRRSARPSRS